MRRRFEWMDSEKSLLINEPILAKGMMENENPSLSSLVKANILSTVIGREERGLGKIKRGERRK